jgi:hypothetical protein
VFAGVLFAALGARWFSHYGLAATVLAALPFAAAELRNAARRNGRTAWPIFAAALNASAACLAQIGFWAAFFSNPGTAVMLGNARDMIKAAFGPYFDWLWILPAALLAAAALHALSPRLAR